VSALMSYFKLSPGDLVIIHDDLDVPPWRLKLTERGGPGGHRGILDIMATLNTEEFLRVKLGIGRPHPPLPTEKYVLSHFPAEDAENVAQLIERAAQAVVTLLAEGLGAAQTRFHGDLEPENEPGKGSKTNQSD
jgi:PTH1 family peptidyl-tRNA hydrolase